VIQFEVRENQPLSSPTLIRFGVFEVDLASGELRKQGVRVKLQDQPFQALVALIERPGEVLTREELQKRLWPSDTTVDFDRGLNKAIARVRDALGDDADNPRFIETLPSRGYRFLSQEGPASSPVAEIRSSPAGLPSVPPWRRFGWIAGGLAVVLLVMIGLYRLTSPSPRIASIAVLPLENLSGIPEQEYFSDGMTDELISEIAQITSLRVISRTSVMRYKGAPRKLLPEIARELHVDAILEGTVVQSGQRVRITAQLIRASDDRHLLSKQYVRELVDILALQGEVARAVAGSIRIKLTPGEQTSLTRTRRVNPEAYEAYLKGVFFLHKALPGTARSIEYFKQAIQLDSLQSEAYSGLAEALCLAGIFGLRPSAETYPEARTAALKALELDPSNAGAHNALAGVRQGHDWDLAGAGAEYQRALQLNPSHLLTRVWYAEHLTRTGHFEEAIAEAAKAVELDPISTVSLNCRAMVFFRSRRYDEAIQSSRKALDIDLTFVNALWWEGLSYAGKGDFPKSIASLTKAVGMNDRPLFRALLGHVYGRAGDRAKALGILDELTRMSMTKQRFVSPMDFAILYAGMGDANQTFQWLEKAYQSRETRIHQLPSMEFDSVRSDPRYADLMRRIGLPVASFL
jgi:TolB-like protein/DNA-binding winged helix-turn-helix (wHTH) protein/tetratricopeptide (TPR) repeat protein